MYNRLIVSNTHKKNWRLFSTFLTQVSQCACHLDLRELGLLVYDSVFNLLRDVKITEGLKPALARLTATMLYSNYRREERHLQVDQIINDLARSKSVALRKTFVTFCEQCVAA